MLFSINDWIFNVNYENYFHKRRMIKRMMEKENRAKEKKRKDFKKF